LTEGKKNEPWGDAGFSISPLLQQAFPGRTNVEFELTEEPGKSDDW